MYYLRNPILNDSHGSNNLIGEVILIIKNIGINYLSVKNISSRGNCKDIWEKRNSSLLISKL